MKSLINLRSFAIYILLACVFCVGCESKSDCLFRMHQEQYRKGVYYYEKALDCLPNIDSTEMYGDSLQMTRYTMDVLGKEWQNAR